MWRKQPIIVMGMWGPLGFDSFFTLIISTFILKHNERLRETSKTFFYCYRNIKRRYVLSKVILF